MTAQASWGGGGQFRPPGDPWAAEARARRAVYGRIYEPILRGRPDGYHAYVGMTTQTIHRRVHGPNGHTSPESIARDPWKADILPGRAGYRQLEAVRDTGDPAENDRALRRAEAFWIDRLRPEHNDVRPVRPPGETRRPEPRATGRPWTPRTPRRRRARPRARVVLLLAFIALFTYLSALFVVAMDLPWPAAPWVAAPVAGTFLGWQTFWRLHAAIRKALR